MGRNYHLDAGYITVPEANQIVLRMLRIVNQDDKSHYNKILEGAKKGQFGGKKYGKRMYQVIEDDIKQYAKKLLQKEQLQLFDIDIVTNLDNGLNVKLPIIDKSTAKKIKYYLTYIKSYQIISEEAFQTGQKNLQMRERMRELSLK